MSKNSKRRRDEKLRKRRKKQRQREARRERFFDPVLVAEELIAAGELIEARDLLEEFAIKGIPRPRLLELLADLYRELNDVHECVEVVRQLVQLDPDEPSHRLRLAGALIAAHQLASATQCFREFVARWPDEPEADAARETIAELEAELRKLGKRYFDPERGDLVELLTLHDEMLGGIALGEYARVVKVGEDLAARAPGFLPGKNNLSQAYFGLGRIDAAVAVARDVVARAPDYVHARANLARMLFLGGRIDSARQEYERLQALPVGDIDEWLKLAETASYFGDDRTVLRALARAKRRCERDFVHPEMALLFHLAAVAAARTGKKRRAKKYWREALRIQPGLDWAQENLAEAEDAAPGVGHGPWAFDLRAWLPGEVVERMIDAVPRPSEDADDASMQSAAQKLVEAHPPIAALVPALLDRGDKAGREFARQFALALATPEMDEALRAYCQSQRGPDQLRVDTLFALCRRKVVSPGIYRMWLKEKWTDIEGFTFEISREPTGPPLPGKVNELAYDGMMTLRCGDGIAAERLFKKCIELHGDDPTLLNNLAQAYLVQGRDEEALELQRDVYARWPDYFFGAICMAREAIDRGDTKRAKELLDPLRHREKLHVTEYSALCAAYAMLHLRDENCDAAQIWIDMLRDVDPDDPNLPTLDDMATFSLIRTWAKRIVTS